MVYQLTMKRIPKLEKLKAVLMEILRTNSVKRCHQPLRPSRAVVAASPSAARPAAARPDGNSLLISFL